MLAVRFLITFYLLIIMYYLFTTRQCLCQVPCFITLTERPGLADSSHGRFPGGSSGGRRSEGWCLRRRGSLAGPHTVFPLCVCISGLFYSCNTCHTGLGPTPMASFLPNCLFKDPHLQIQSPSEVRLAGLRFSAFEFWGRESGKGWRHNSAHNRGLDSVAGLGLFQHVLLKSLYPKGR